MAKSEDILSIFTDEYPFGNGETFFTDELSELSFHFDKIIIQPLVGKGHKRSVPSNVFVNDPVFKKLSYRSILLKGFFNFAPFGKVWRLFGKNFIQSSGQYLISRALYSKCCVDLSMETVKYFYWGKGCSSICVFYKISGRKVVRFHRYDLYGEDVNKGNIIPLRKYLLSEIDQAIFISQHGYDYQMKHHKFKGSVFRLGVKYCASNPVTESIDCLVLVSCSSIIPVKRISFLADSLKNTTRKIKWIHLGSGPDVEEVQKIIDSFPTNVSGYILGSLSHGEVLKFYRENHVDLLINVSSSEGIPVSMMEALSFGIPVMGTDVGGVSELISSESGYLLDKEISSVDLAALIDDLKFEDLQKLRSGAFSTYRNKFNDKKNYEELGRMLKSLPLN